MGFVIYLGIGGAFLIAYAAAYPRMTIRRYRRKLRAMTPDELADEARNCAKGAGYERAFSDAALFRQLRDWSQLSLSRAIDDLYARAVAKDQQEGRSLGRRDSLVFDFYDHGLASIREVLDGRPPA
jgi:hypothetical protein